MKENENEVPWNCSPTFIFGVMDRFMERLEKVCDLLIFEWIIVSQKSLKI